MAPPTPGRDGGSRRVAVALGGGLRAQTPQAPQVSIADINPDSTVERALRDGGAGAGGGFGMRRAPPGARAADAPDQSRGAHAHAAVFERARGAGWVAAWVTRPGTMSVPDSIEAVLRVNGVQKAGGRWGGSEWATANQRRRILLRYLDVTLATGAYPYTLEVASLYGGSRLATTVSGTLVVVNRRGKATGGGWRAGATDPVGLRAGVDRWRRECAGVPRRRGQHVGGPGGGPAGHLGLSAECQCGARACGG